MNLLASLQETILNTFHAECGTPIQVTLNVDKPSEFGDLNCNGALILAKIRKQSPQKIAEQFKQAFSSPYVSKVEIVNPGFINFYLTPQAWHQIAQELFITPKDYFSAAQKDHKKYLIEFVSANPTGPLHLGHGRGGIIGDVLANVLNYMGHTAEREFYINDAGNQIQKLGTCLKVRCLQQLSHSAELPEDGYAGAYLIDLAKQCIEEHGKTVIKNDNQFFATYAKDKLLEQIKQTLLNYGIAFDHWFSELTLHQNGSIDNVVQVLQDKKIVYEKDDALWFTSTAFGDDKDRVIKKGDGTYTYIAPDIAYHKNKFDRGYDILINVLGQDHHGYVKRLKGTINALGYDDNKLDVILYQMVSMKQGDEYIKMSKRAGTFETLADIIDKVGVDVARFFYLNRKAEAHLDFDLDIALKKTDENPVYYIQYAYVRTKSLLAKAQEFPELNEFVKESPLRDASRREAEIAILKKICSLHSILTTIATTYQTHLLSYYTLELAQLFHNYYASNKIIDIENIETSKKRLLITKIIQQTLGTCLDLLGLSKPERM